MDAAVRADVPAVPTLVLSIFLILGNGAAAVYGFAMRPIPGTFMSHYPIALSFAIAWWIVADAQRHQVANVIDFGWFVFLAWPLIAPWYLFRTRRSAGCGIALLIFFAFSASYVTAFLIGSVLHAAH